MTCCLRSQSCRKKRRSPHCVVGVERFPVRPADPRALFRLMTPAQQQALVENTSRAMGDAPEEIKRRHIGNCTKCDPAYGAEVAKALDMPTLVLRGLSQRVEDGLLGPAAGAMIFVVSHEVIPETHRNGHQKFATPGLMAGFALMMVLDTTLG
jgi:hypothetical protein